MKKFRFIWLAPVALVLLVIAAASPPTNNFNNIKVKYSLEASNVVFSGTFSATVPLATWAAHVDGANVSNAVTLATTAITATNIAGVHFTGTLTVVTNGTDTMSLLFTNGVLGAVAAP